LAHLAVESGNPLDAPKPTTLPCRLQKVDCIIGYKFDAKQCKCVKVGGGAGMGMSGGMGMAGGMGMGGGMGGGKAKAKGRHN